MSELRQIALALALMLFGMTATSQSVLADENTSDDSPSKPPVEENEADSDDKAKEVLTPVKTIEKPIRAVRRTIKPKDAQRTAHVAQVAERKKRRAEATKAIDLFLRSHVDHANNGDIDAYMADFHDRLTKNKKVRSHAERVIQEHKPNIQIDELVINSLKGPAAKVSLAQRSSYIDQNGDPRTDKATVEYTLRKTDAGWRIAGTKRTRAVLDDVQE